MAANATHDTKNNVGIIYDTDEEKQIDEKTGEYLQGITNDVMSMEDREVYKTEKFKEGDFKTSDKLEEMVDKVVDESEKTTAYAGGSYTIE